MSFDSVFTKITNGCTQAPGVFTGLLVGLILGSLWYSLLQATGNQKLTYFNEFISNNVVCSRPQKQTFKVRIQYSDNNNTEYFGEFNSATKIQRPDSRVRIKMKIEDYEYIKDAKRFEFDGRLFLLDSDPRFHGLFNVHFCTIYLKPIESK